MQRSIVQTLYGHTTRLGLAPRMMVCEYSTVNLLRPKPTNLMNNKNKAQMSDANRLDAVRQLLQDHRKPISSNKKPKPLQASTTAADKSGRSRRDEEITSRWITFVDEKGNIHEDHKRLDQVLQEFDRSLYFLVEVNPSARPPVCRLFEKKQLFDKTKASKKKIVSSNQVTKEIVFGWNVSPHDMGHKLGKAIQFLDKGNKVKIDIVYKKGQKRVDKETQQGVIDQVKQHLDIYKIAKPPTLSGSNCMMVFEQKK